MNVRMWLHKATQKNLNTLIDYGYKFIGPEDGDMACGEYGKGKMSSPRQILSCLEKFFRKKDLLKKKNKYNCNYRTNKRIFRSCKIYF